MSVLRPWVLTFWFGAVIGVWLRRFRRPRPRRYQ